MISTTPVPLTPKLSKGFLQMKNCLFGSNKDPTTSTIHSIGTIGYSILSYLVYKSRGEYQTTIDLQELISSLEITKRTIRKYLPELQQNNLIICNKDLSTIVMKDRLSIGLIPYYQLKGGFEKIPKSIYIDYYDTLTPIGWTILCFLAKMQNINFGNKGSQGFTSISEERIGEFLGIHKNTVSTHISQIKKLKLIKITKGKNIISGYDEYGNPIKTYTPNQYHVMFKD